MILWQVFSALLIAQTINILNVKIYKNLTNKAISCDIINNVYRLKNILKGRLFFMKTKIIKRIFAVLLATAMITSTVGVVSAGKGKKETGSKVETGKDKKKRGVDPKTGEDMKGRKCLVRNIAQNFQEGQAYSKEKFLEAFENIAICLEDKSQSNSELAEQSRVGAYGVYHLIKCGCLEKFDKLSDLLQVLKSLNLCAHNAKENDKYTIEWILNSVGRLLREKPLNVDMLQAERDFLVKSEFNFLFNAEVDEEAHYYVKCVWKILRRCALRLKGTNDKKINDKEDLELFDQIEACLNSLIYNATASKYLKKNVKTILQTIDWCFRRDEVKGKAARCIFDLAHELSKESCSDSDLCEILFALYKHAESNGEYVLKALKILKQRFGLTEGVFLDAVQKIEEKCCKNVDLKEKKTLLDSFAVGRCKYSNISPLLEVLKNSVDKKDVVDAILELTYRDALKNLSDENMKDLLIALGSCVWEDSFKSSVVDVIWRLVDKNILKNRPGEIYVAVAKLLAICSQFDGVDASSILGVINKMDENLDVFAKINNELAENIINVLKICADRNKSYDIDDYSDGQFALEIAQRLKEKPAFEKFQAELSKITKQSY